MRTETLLVAGGLAVVVGGTLLWSAFGGDTSRSTTEAVVMIAPPAAPEVDAPPATAALPNPEASPNYVPVTGPAEYMVTTRLTSIHLGPSATASVLYAFPTGRRLRVVGREAGFARIEDLQSKATGWVDESLLAPISATASVKPTAPSAPSDATVPDGDAEPASSPPPAAAKPPAPKPAAKPAAAPKPRAVTGTEPPTTAAQKQAAAKRAQQRAAETADKNRGFPGFLNRAFGGR